MEHKKTRNIYISEISSYNKRKCQIKQSLKKKKNPSLLLLDVGVLQ